MKYPFVGHVDLYNKSELHIISTGVILVSPSIGDGVGNVQGSSGVTMDLDVPGRWREQ